MTDKPTSRASDFDAPLPADSTSSAPSARTTLSTLTTGQPKNLKLISTNYGSAGGARTAIGTDASLPMTAEHRARWHKRGIDPDLALRYGVHTRLDGAVGFHYLQDGEVYNTKLRYGKGQMPWASKRDPLIFWNIDCLTDDPAPDEFVIITEGEPDALSCLQVGFTRVLSLPNGAVHGDNGFKFLYDDDRDSLLPGLQKFQDIVVAVDDDKPGRECRDNLIRRLDALRVRVPTYPKGCKDANEVLVRHGPDALRQLIFDASHVWRGEIRRLSDVPDPAPLEPVASGIAGLDEHGFRLLTPGLMAIVGPYGSGKSVLLRQLLVSLWRKHGWRFLITALEERIKWRYANSFTKLLAPGFASDLDPSALEKVHEEIDSCARFLSRPHGRLADPEWLIDRMEIAIKREGVKVVAIDPVNQIDTVLGRGENYTDYMGRFLMDLQRLAEDYNILIIVCAHPDKAGVRLRNSRSYLPSINDASGTAHFGNKADIGWYVWRPHGDGPTMLHIDKLKDEQHMGRPTVAKLLMTEAREEFTAAVIGYKGFWSGAYNGSSSDAGL